MKHLKIYENNLTKVHGIPLNIENVFEIIIYCKKRDISFELYYHVDSWIITFPNYDEKQFDIEYGEYVNFIIVFCYKYLDKVCIKKYW